jgi:hypothetical protein
VGPIRAYFSTPTGSGSSPLTVAAGDPTGVQSFLQQPDECLRRFHLLFRGDLLDDGLNRSLNQHTQYRVRIRADRTGHADRLGQDMHRIGPVGDDALNPVNERFDSGKRSLWHGESIARRMAV